MWRALAARRRLVQCAPGTPADPTRSPAPSHSCVASTHRPKSLSRSVWRPPRVAPPVRAAILVPGAGRVHKRAAAPVIDALWPPVAPRGAGGAHRGVFANFGSCACGPWRAGAPVCHRQVSNRPGAWGLNPFRSLRVACCGHATACSHERPSAASCPTTHPPACVPHEQQQQAAREATPPLKRLASPPASPGRPPVAGWPTPRPRHLTAGCLPAPRAAPPRTVWPRPASLRRRVQPACRRQTSSACWTAMMTSRSRSSRWAAQGLGGQSCRARVLAQPRASVHLPLPPPSSLPTASSSLPPFACSSPRAVEGLGRRSRQPLAHRGASSRRSSSDDLQQPGPGAVAAAAAMLLI